MTKKSFNKGNDRVFNPTTEEDYERITHKTRKEDALIASSSGGKLTEAIPKNALITPATSDNKIVGYHIRDPKCLQKKINDFVLNMTLI